MRIELRFKLKLKAQNKLPLVQLDKCGDEGVLQFPALEDEELELVVVVTGRTRELPPLAPPKLFKLTPLLLVTTSATLPPLY
jgi:hypothetical protein